MCGMSDQAVWAHCALAGSRYTRRRILTPLRCRSVEGGLRLVRYNNETTWLCWSNTRSPPLSTSPLHAVIHHSTPCSMPTEDDDQVSRIAWKCAESASVGIRCFTQTHSGPAGNRCFELVICTCSFKPPMTPSPSLASVPAELKTGN